MFKVGDIVTPVKESRGFLLGSNYTLFEVLPTPGDRQGDQWLRVKEDSDGVENGWGSINFELVSRVFIPNCKTLTLPTDSEARKQIPMFSGCIKYFPAAIAGVAKISKAGNDKHNPGQELHHDRSKSLDHADCIIRHLADVADLIASLERGDNKNPEQVLAEVSSLAWRALAYSQTLHEKYDGAPLAPGAK